MYVKKIIILLSGLFLLGCKGDAYHDGEPNCEVIHTDPLITIDGYIPKNSDLVPISIQIYNVLLDGKVLPFEEWGVEGGSELIDAGDNWGFCDIPCSLFTKEGHYSFDVVARGAGDPISTSVQAEFEEHTSGCPAIYSGGISLVIGGES